MTSSLVRRFSKILSSYALAANLRLSNKSIFAYSSPYHSAVLAHQKPLSCNSLASSSSAMSGTTTNALTIAQFPCLNDNYGYLVHDEMTGETVAIDTPCALTYRAELQKRGWTLSAIWNTHHHHDHTGGNLDLKQMAGVKIYGPASEKIPGMDVGLKGGDSFEFGSGSQVSVLDVGGHTAGHIAYYLPRDSKLFCGDALFSLGCGRMFEGTPSQFWSSLQTLRSLPDDTLVYCAHEYTEANAKFALSVEPSNANLQSRASEVRQKRLQGEPTVPTSIGEEKKTNPFFRVDFSEEIRMHVGVNDDDTGADAFHKVRKAKDRFRG